LARCRQVTTAVRFQVASVVDHKPIHGIAEEENDLHAGSSDFLEYGIISSTRSFFSVEPIPAQPRSFLQASSLFSAQQRGYKRLGTRYALSDSGRTPEIKRSVESY